MNTSHALAAIFGACMLSSCAYSDSHSIEEQRERSKATARNTVSGSPHDSAEVAGQKKTARGSLASHYDRSPVADSGNSDSAGGGRTDIDGNPTDPAVVPPGTALPGNGTNGGSPGDGSSRF